MSAPETARGRAARLADEIHALDDEINAFLAGSRPMTNRYYHEYLQLRDRRASLRRAFSFWRWRALAEGEGWHYDKESDRP